MECHSAIKMNEIMPFFNNVKGPKDYHTKLSRSERKTNSIAITTYIENLRCDANGHIYKTEQIHRLIVQTLQGGRRRERDGPGFGVSRHKLLH